MWAWAKWDILFIIIKPNFFYCKIYHNCAGFSHGLMDGRKIFWNFSEYFWSNSSILFQARVCHIWTASMHPHWKMVQFLYVSSIPFPFFWFCTPKRPIKFKDSFLFICSVSRAWWIGKWRQQMIFSTGWITATITKRRAWWETRVRSTQRQEEVD